MPASDGERSVVVSSHERLVEDPAEQNGNLSGGQMILILVPSLNDGEDTLHSELKDHFTGFVVVHTQQSAKVEVFLQHQM